MLKKFACFVPLSLFICSGALMPVTRASAQTKKTNNTLTSTGSQGSYVFTSTVNAFGPSNPTGNVVFNDTTTGTTLGTIALGTANTTGGFGTSLTLSSQYNPDGAIVADVNKDGIPDLIVMLSNPYASAAAGQPANGNPNCAFCPGPQNIQVYLGKGDGTFQNPSYYQAGFNPDHVTVADINNDGYPDLIVTNNFPVYGGTPTSGGAYPTAENFYEISVYLNKGATAPGTFAATTYYKTGNGPISAVVGDFTGDGIPDIIVANQVDGTLQLFPGNNTGMFANPVTGGYSNPVVGTNSSPAPTIVATNVGIQNNHGLAAADVNGDGILDLVVVNYNTGNVEVYLGQGSGGKGNGTFAAAALYPAGTGTLTSVNPVGVALGDVNNDNHLDIVTSNRGTGTVGVLLNQGNGTFGAVTTYPIGDGGSSLANGVTLADMNNDGNLDIAVADNGKASSLGVLFGTGTGTFGTRVGVGTNEGSGTPLVGDFNGDGRLDFATENFGPNTTTVLLGFATETAVLSNINLPGATTDTVTATYAGNTVYVGSTSNSLSLASGGLANPTVTAPTSVTAGQAFSFTVTEKNRTGTTATTYNGTLTFTSSDPLAKLPAPSMLSNGTGTFSATLSDDGTQTITATDSANNIQTVTPIAVTGGKLVVSGFPTSDANGTAQTVTVTVQDTAGNTMTGFTGTVTLSSSDTSAAFSPATYTYTSADAGVHVFTVTLSTGGTQSIMATSTGLTSGVETGIMVSDYVWLVNGNGTLTRVAGNNGAAAGSATTGGTAATLGGVAFDNAGNVWTVNSGSNSLFTTTKAGGAATAYTGGGLSTPVAVTVDGAGQVWVANSGNNSLSVFSNGTAVSGTSGFGTSDGLSAPSAIAVDNTGGIWVTNQTGNSVTHIFGGAQPLTVPLASAVSAAALGVKP